MYEIGWGILYEMVGDEFDRDDINLQWPKTYQTIHLMKTQPNLAFFDIQSTPTVENTTILFRKSFDMAVDSLESIKSVNGGDIAWYKYKNTTIRHLLRLAPFSVSQVRIGGNHNIVNAASGSHGPSWRMVVKLTPEKVSAWGVYPGGQPGNPGHPMYSGMIENWATGNYYSMQFTQSMMPKESVVSETTLNPRP
jgi:penicillin amidase